MNTTIPSKYTLHFASPMPIKSERQYEEYVSALEALSFKRNPTAAEERYGEVLATLIEAYEDEHYEIPDASPVEVLRTLMEANNLKQKDLASLFGSESIVSEVLHESRQLNKTHIERLSLRFHVSPEVFFHRASAVRHTRTRTAEE